MDRNVESIVKTIPPEHREWFRERYPELRQQIADHYQEQVALGRMTRQESLEQCGQALLRAIQMELSIRL